MKAIASSPIGAEFQSLKAVLDRLSTAVDAFEARHGAMSVPDDGLDDLSGAPGAAVDLEAAQLAHRILGAVEDMSRRLDDRSDALVAARTDQTTGLGNLGMLRERLSALLANDEPAHADVALVVVSLERFKAIATSLGRADSDAVLRVVVDRIRSLLCDEDVFARVSDDEFAIVRIGSSGLEAAMGFATRLVELVGRSYLVNGNLVNIGVCAGICVAPARTADCTSIFDNAELTLAHAKQDGAGHVRVFDAAMGEARADRRLLEVDLRRALALRELKLVYQPQFNLASQQITGFEALLRWHHPTRGLISPVEFIPVAEELGLIVSIGEWVLLTACREAARWPDHLKVAVNVSGVQFRNAKLRDEISAALARSGLAPERLELEITESVLLSNHAPVLDMLHGIRRTGVHISMDDFGTGYSSLSYLSSFPFDKIKIDQSFIRGRMDATSSTAIVRAIAALGRALGMTTTAEGIETEEQLARIAAAGCTDIQGYLISRPLPPEQIDDFLQQNHARKLPEPVERATS